MKAYLTKLIDSNYFFLSLVAFAMTLPLSVALVSVFSAFVLVVALVEDNWTNKWARMKDRKYLLLILLVFLMYVLSTFFIPRGIRTYYDVQKSMFYFIFPLAFCFGKKLTQRQVCFVFYSFALAILIAIVIALYRWCFGNFKDANFGVHKISLISHIRFSFQLILISWFFVLLILYNYRTIGIRLKIGMLILILIYIGFLFFQQSLTGIVAFVCSVIFFFGYLMFHVKPKWRVVCAIAFFMVLLAPSLYLYSAIHKFYQFDAVVPEQLDGFTANGNKYSHDLNNKMVENGHYVGLYVCNDEMRKAWNKRSAIKFDSISVSGYPTSVALIRYLTSMGLRKDADGVNALSVDDISNVENGIANVVYTHRYSLYPRIYETIWEYYVYSQTGNPNDKSFAQRIEFAKAAITIIKSHFWFGVGAERWENAFANAFKENNSQLIADSYASAHNQYLNYMVKFGVVGFVFILFVLIFPVIKSRRYRDTLFMLFLVAMFFANFADSNIETHIGSAFFFFFYCLFVVQKGNYLKLRTGNRTS